MYNLHTHSLHSDGVLLPSEIAVRYLALGYKAIAITDHTDYSNIESNIKSILEFTRRWPSKLGIKVFPGIELTHVPCSQFKPLAEYARAKGIKIIIAHGETTVEPMLCGTNRAALEADIDILAHPGLINDRDVMLAKKKNIFLEVTTRSGHSNTNRHVVKQARKFGAKIILSHDAHAPEDIISIPETVKAAKRCGLGEKEIKEIFHNIGLYLKKKEAR